MLREETEKVLEELLVSHLTLNQEREVWGISEQAPFTNLDYVQKHFSEEIFQALTRILELVEKCVPEKKKVIIPDQKNGITDQEVYQFLANIHYNQALAEIKWRIEK